MTKFRLIGHPASLLGHREPSGIRSLIGPCAFLLWQSITWLIYKSLTQVLIWQWRRAPRRSITYTIILVPSSLKVVWSIIGMLLCFAVLTSLSHSRIWAVWLSAQPNSGQSFQLRKDGSPCIVEQGQFKESEPVRGYLLVWSKIR